MVTGSTYLKKHYLRTPIQLTLVQSRLFDVAEEFGWQLQAWAVLSNHYHFVALSPEDPKTLRTIVSKLHTTTAIELNKQDEAPGRKVWFQYYDSHITYQASYLARLKYVHQNAVHHKIATHAENYPWCSAAWFAQQAQPAFYKTVQSFRTDRIKVTDDFDAISANDS